MNKLFIVVNVDWFFLSHRKDIAISAYENNYDVTIVAKDTGRRAEIEALGLRFIDLPMNRSGQNIFEELSTFNFLFSLYKREKPDIVHHVGLKTILWGTLAAKLAKVKGVVNAVSGLGILFSEENKSIISKILLTLLRFSHNRRNLFVIFQNDEDMSLFVDNNIIKKTQIRKIRGSGVDLDTFSYTQEPESTKIRILFTARMIVEKGVFVLIDAANQLKTQYGKHAEFLLCGGIDDNPKAITKEELELLCDGTYIQWLGFRKDVCELLKSSHIVAFPSFYKEGLPKSLIEACAIGRPIITTNSIGCRETVVDGENGFLIPVKDSKSLATRLEQLIISRDLRLKMGKKSRELAETEFSIENVVRKHLEIYNELVNSEQL